MTQRELAELANRSSVVSQSGRLRLRHEVGGRATALFPALLGDQRYPLPEWGCSAAHATSRCTAGVGCASVPTRCTLCDVGQNWSGHNVIF